MKKLTLMLALSGFAFGASTGAIAGIASHQTTSGVVFAQEDCKEGEKWNEETKACEAASGN